MPASTIGARQKFVVIEQQLAPTGGGFPSPTWIPLGNPVWMERIDMSGDERFAAAQLSAVERPRWRMPYQSDMDPETVDVPKLRRLVYRDRVYDIQRAIPIGQRNQIELDTQAKVG
jgi:hypothetical protein